MDDRWSARAAGAGYLEHLSAADLELLGRLPGVGGASALRGSPSRIPALLDHGDLAALVLARGGHERAADTGGISPLLVFAVTVARSAGDLAKRSYTEEWVGLHRRVTVFDVGALRDFLDDPVRRLFLAELLASYTKISSGSTWEHSARGWRRRRFSDLDPVRLAELALSADAQVRPGVYRRLGDLALFLTGVFPDHTAREGMSPWREARLAQAFRLGEGGGEAGSLPVAVGDLGAVGVLEEVGRRAYAVACRSARPPLSGTMAAVQELAARFRVARRVLNYCSEQYLLDGRGPLFGAA